MYSYCYVYVFLLLCLCILIVMYALFCTRAVREVSGHFEYLENWSRGLDVTWLPCRGDLTAHP